MARVTQPVHNAILVEKLCGTGGVSRIVAIDFFGPTGVGILSRILINLSYWSAVCTCACRWFNVVVQRCLAVPSFLIVHIMSALFAILSEC